MKCMERLVEKKIDAPHVEATIIDGAVIVQILKPGMAASFMWMLCGMYIVKTV